MSGCTISIQWECRKLSVLKGKGLCISSGAMLMDYRLDAIQKKDEQNGFATATAAYLILADQGADIGGTRKSTLSQGDDEDDEEDAPCDPNGPDNIKDVDSALGSIPAYCSQQHAIKVFDKNLNDVMASYSKDFKGYDKAFGYFSDYIKDSVSPRLKEFMDLDKGPGNKFFTCEWSASISAKHKEKCPPADKFWQLDQSWEITYTLDDEAGFYAAVEKELGIPKEWIEFGTVDKDYGCATDQSNTPRPGSSASRPCRKEFRKRFNFPQSVDKKKITVPSPKDVIAKAHANLTDLQSLNSGTYVSVLADLADFELSDVVSASSLPVFMIEEALSNMKDVMKTGNEIAAAKQRDLALTILGLVFLVLPFVGEAIGAAFGGAAMVARMLMVIGEVGNVALSAENIARGRSRPHKRTRDRMVCLRIELHFPFSRRRLF